MERLLNVKQLAEVLNTKPGTIYSWISRHVDMPPSIRIGGTTRWRLSTVEQWVAEKERAWKKRHFEL